MNHADPTPQTERVVTDVIAERHRQIDKGWTPEHDDGHRLIDLVGLARDRIDFKAAPAPLLLRSDLLEAAAILVAAIESIDRRTQP